MSKRSWPALDASKPLVGRETDEQDRHELAQIAPKQYDADLILAISDYRVLRRIPKCTSVLAA
jgi:hypothetical protein